MNEVQNAINARYMAAVQKKSLELGYDYEKAPFESKAQILKIVEAAWREKAIKYEQQEAKEREKQLQAEKKRAYEKYRDSIPKMFKDADIKQFNANSPIVKHIIDGGSALIIGGTGVGKTHLAYACAKELSFIHSDAASVKVIDMSQMLSDVKLSDKDWLKDITKHYGCVQSLFIDEYDKMFGTQADYQLVSHLINKRWEEGLQTVVLGNGTEEIARNLLGAACISRLVGKATGGAFFNVGGADRRRA